MFNLILFGPPGSGKGTQSEKLIAQYNLKHLSTGDLLRSEIARKTSLGIEAKILMDKGNLVPDQVVIGFDGFPRTAVQAEELDRLLAKKDTCIDVMIALDVSEHELVHRLMKRGETSGRSDDDNEQVIRARILEYHKKTAAVADHYQKAHKVILVKGEGTVEEIFQGLCNEIDRMMKQNNCA